MLLFYYIVLGLASVTGAGTSTDRKINEINNVAEVSAFTVEVNNEGPPSSHRLNKIKGCP
ncbi:hypothetical protein BEP19_11345 [Ammoniphilus oxalaticus]|uniref:Uncharacterized protein n=1 Tax=Ammoniphilus oxalaticus TaxID=66863 RepID=A0A419SGC1_9BACL|nr:hypothetical protein BEP19_11345 [Ammoniphilus oxalaticus]